MEQRVGAEIPLVRPQVDDDSVAVISGAVVLVDEDLVEGAGVGDGAVTRQRQRQPVERDRRTGGSEATAYAAVRRGEAPVGPSLNELEVDWMREELRSDGQR